MPLFLDLVVSSLLFSSLHFTSLPIPSTNTKTNTPQVPLHVHQPRTLHQRGRRSRSRHWCQHPPYAHRTAEGEAVAARESWGYSGAARRSGTRTGGKWEGGDGDEGVSDDCMFTCILMIENFFFTNGMAGAALSGTRRYCGSSRDYEEDRGWMIS